MNDSPIPRVRLLVSCIMACTRTPLLDAPRINAVSLRASPYCGYCKLRPRRTACNSLALGVPRLLPDPAVVALLGASKLFRVPCSCLVVVHEPRPLQCPYSKCSHHLCATL
jgi:hypothetical protein